MSLTKGLAFVLGAALCVHAPHRAFADDDNVDATDEEEEDSTPDKPKPPKAKPSEEFRKQDLTGHDLGTDKKENLFEKDRFFVDKVDTSKTEKGTLVQGSLTSTSFAYREGGGTIAPNAAGVPSASQFSRIFTDLRLQTDFRHIGGGKWEARIDARGRFTTDPGPQTANYVPPTDSATQSGFLGQNELELRELWLIRNGKRSDIIFGRQFIADLAGVKIDGLRIDYASSSKFTLLGFGGLYPIRGSRSISTDYTELKASTPDATGERPSAGKFTGAGGFGAAYRTQNAYGAFGGVALVPFQAEQPRVFGTATGYWRPSPKLDIYHFAVVDVYGSNAVNAGITNLSAGINYKPDQRLRLAASVNRVDTDTLNVQAQAFLNNPEQNISTIQNEAFLIRIAQNQARASLSAGLGNMQRFEITTSVAYRYREGVTLTSPDNMTKVELQPGSSVEVFGGITDRRSFANLRLGVDGSRIFRVGDAAYQRTSALGLRAFAARELASGHGEWEAEVAYASTKDDQAGMDCQAANIGTCFGASTSTILSIGGSLFYRFNRDWFAMGGLYLTTQNITHVEMAGSAADPMIYGVSGFFRLAYRF